MDPLPAGARLTPGILSVIGHGKFCRLLRQIELVAPEPAAAGGRAHCSRRARSSISRPFARPMRNCASRAPTALHSRRLRPSTLTCWAGPHPACRRTAAWSSSSRRATLRCRDRGRRSDCLTTSSRICARSSSTFSIAAGSSIR